MLKRSARIYLAAVLLAGIAINCIVVFVALHGGIVYFFNIAEILLALVAVYSPHLAVIFGAIGGDTEPHTVASKKSFAIAVTSIALWTLLITTRSVWFATTAFTGRTDSFKSLIEFWGVVGGMGSLFVAGPLGFFIAKREL
jgi:hypothetical protein